VVIAKGKATPTAPLNHRSTTAQPPLNHRSTTAQSLLNHCSTTAQSLLNHRSITAQSPLNYRSTNTMPMLPPRVHQLLNYYLFNQRGKDVTESEWQIFEGIWPSKKSPSTIFRSSSIN
jgi:hypothetical protein